MGKQWKQCQTLSFWAPKSLQMVIAAMKLKDSCPLEEKLWQPRQHIKKQRHYFANKCPSSQSCCFSSIHVWMWELDYKESWAPEIDAFESWFQKHKKKTLVRVSTRRLVEKTLESPLDCKEIWPVHPKRNQSWIFIGRTNAEAETLIP